MMEAAIGTLIETDGGFWADPRSTILIFDAIALLLFVVSLVLFCRLIHSDGKDSHNKH
jgi:hypothetical protein